MLCRRPFQYSVICHYSQNIKLALTDFNKNRVFYRICMWLQLSQVLKKIHRRKREKSSLYFFTLTSQKSIKHASGITRESPLAQAYGSKKPSFIFRSTGRIMNGVLTVVSLISGHLSKEEIERLSFLPIKGSFLRIT